MTTDSVSGTLIVSLCYDNRQLILYKDTIKKDLVWFLTRQAVLLHQTIAPWLSIPPITPNLVLLNQYPSSKLLLRQI